MEVRVKDHKRLYNLWQGMKQRCNNPNNISYKNYGGRGISYDIGWEIFQGFFNDMAESYYKHVEEYGERDTTLDRIDVDGNYSKENCTWATWHEQALNKRTSPYTIAKACEGKDVDIRCVYARVENGWDLDDAINMPVGSKYIEILGMTLIEKCKELDMPYSAVCRRIQNGMSVEEALSKPIAEFKYLEFLGKSLRNYCADLGLSYEAVRSRLRRGWLLDEAISEPVKCPTKYAGKSLSELCRNHNIRIATVKARMNRGWTLEESLNTPVGQKCKEADSNA